MKNSRLGKLVVAALFVPLLAGAFVALAPQATRAGVQQIAAGPVAWPPSTKSDGRLS